MLNQLTPWSMEHSKTAVTAEPSLIRRDGELATRCQRFTDAELHRLVERDEASNQNRDSGSQ
jgi:hypothetical protein